MTWNWKWSLAATSATAMAGWLASPPLERATTRGEPAAAASQGGVGPEAVADIQEQARRLSARLSAGPAAGIPERNPFKFGLRPVPQRAPAAVAAPPAAAPSVDNLPAPFPLRLAGIAVDTIDGVEIRIAVISGPGGVELARSGEAAAAGYRVLTVGDSFAEIERLSDGRIERLDLAP